MDIFTKEMELGRKMTFLTDQEAKDFLKKYDKIIILESRKRTQLPGIGREDLAQACREKLLMGLNSFDENKSSEKTWVIAVIKKTLNGIWNQSFKKKRVCHLLDDDNNEEKPFRDFSIETYKNRNETESIPFIETYPGSPDGRPVYGTTSFSPEEYLRVIQALRFLKTKLSQEAYALIKQELLPELEELIKEDTNFETNYELKKPEEYEIWSIFSELKEKEIQLLSQIGDFFVHVLGFEKEQILERTKTIDIKIS